MARGQRRPSSSGSSSSRRGIGLANLFRGVFVRVFFFLHALLYTWRVVDVSENNSYWALLGVQLLVLIEAFVSLRWHKSGEWKWFTPCIFLYLCNVIPCVWFLELESLNARLVFIEEQNLASCVPPQSNETAWLSFYDISVPVQLTDEAWSLALQQFFLFFLIAGRWILPKKLSHEKLSNLLLINIGMAADIVEFLAEGNLEGANCDRMVTIMILIIWSVSVMQFPFHGDGEELRRTSIVSTLQRRDSSLLNITCLTRCFNFDVWSIFAIIFMQDGPFLAMRVYLIYLYGISDQSLVFFSAKNKLVLMLQFYRIIALLCLETDAYGRTSLRFSKKVKNIRRTVRHLTGWDPGNQDEDQSEVDAENRNTEEQSNSAGASGYDNQFQVEESPPGDDAPVDDAVYGRSDAQL